MKTLPILASTLLLMVSCSDKKLQTFTANVPIYMSYEELRSSFSTAPAEDLEKPGKIVLMDNWLYINEYKEGIHVLDLSNPADVKQVAWINIPGNVDMAIRNNVLYADSYTDLLLVDISDPAVPGLIRREEDFFEYVIPEWDYDYPLADIEQDKGVITGYDIKKYTREIHYNPMPWPIYYEYSSDLALSSSRPSSGGGSYGVGGSMARFLCFDDYLYVLESDYLLRSINVSDENILNQKSEQYLWGNVDTLLISVENMYVVISQCMHIMSLELSSSPVKLSTYSHITACDPVVVSGKRAYITLRSGNLCGGDRDLLEVVSLEDLYNPVRIASYPMTEPYGLGIDGSTLFICEGEYGLKVFDASDDQRITDNLLADFPGFHAWDVIPANNLLMLTGADGFYLYDYTDLQNIKVLDSILVRNPEE